MLRLRKDKNWLHKRQRRGVLKLWHLWYLMGSEDTWSSIFPSSHASGFWTIFTVMNVFLLFMPGFSSTLLWVAWARSLYWMTTWGRSSPLQSWDIQPAARETRWEQRWRCSGLVLTPFAVAFLCHRLNADYFNLMGFFFIFMCDSWLSPSSPGYQEATRRNSAASCSDLKRGTISLMLPICYWPDIK